MYTPMTATELETGKPASTTVFGKVKGNFEDHETRIAALELGSTTDYPPILFHVNGPYWVNGVKNDVVRAVSSFSLNVVGVRIIVGTAGTAGTLSVDIKKKSGGGAWTSILNTQPSVAFGAGNDAVSVNAVVNPAQQLVLAGDLLRLDITGVQANGVSFMVRVDYNHA